MNVEEFTAAAAERLRDVRRKRDLSLADVERESRGTVSASALGSYERGERNIGLRQLKGVADVYGVSVLALMPVEEQQAEFAVIDRALRTGAEALDVTTEALDKLVSITAQLRAFALELDKR